MTRKLKDTFYQDEEYTLIKRDIDECGHFEPMTCLDIIHIALQPLKDWQNGGLKNKKDYEEIINKICDELKSTISND
jgi:hypothetical protein